MTPMDWRKGLLLTSVVLPQGRAPVVALHVEEHTDRSDGGMDESGTGLGVEGNSLPLAYGE
ncbi:hypothetical protein N7532_002477 [Penicillium argentinense]|uniref:Uncharacterized protein n=1 Tax=Penicillium argentinense TaxID=1131581 RepID=A0A9W9KLK0_9EURO|nr:uncharacterized protein N7532_002477 [Penicillium argentinense]KAJ5109832.1 hypothetical protein N7532_002477 [Penicillium argentinense]